MSLRDMFGTYLFLIPLLVLCLTEFTKSLVDYLRTHRWPHNLFRPGGMPSTHSAFVTSLLIVVGRKTGVESPAFAISVVLSCIVWYDAIGVRGTLGEQAQVLNILQHFHKLRETLGHSLLEVLVGIAFGAAVTMMGIWVGA